MRPTEHEIQMARRAELLNNLQEALREVQDEMERAGESPGQWQGALTGFFDLSGEPQPTSAELWGADAAKVDLDGPAATIARRRLARALYPLEVAREKIENLATEIVATRMLKPGAAWEEIDEMVQLLMAIDPRPEIPPEVEELEAALAVPDFEVSRPMDALAEVAINYALRLVRGS